MLPDAINDDGLIKHPVKGLDRRYIDELLVNAEEPDRNGLSVAGRALQKHGGREGSAFLAAKGSAATISSAGQEVVEEILSNPNSVATSRYHARFGNIIDVRAPDGRGVRIDSNGKLIGLLEPNE
ncbi:hypothetical protein NG825_20680 [Xanthomonas sacchari]|nr:hypothetical protein NG825_20680 [Xanthomonas sacchari]